MKDLGYGADHKYAHEYEDAITDQEYFPQELAGRRYYFPKEVGREKRLAEYLQTYQEYRKRMRGARPADSSCLADNTKPRPGLDDSPA
jgi:putative ATPase